MRVVINDLMTLRHKNPSGIGYYALELVRALRERVGADAIRSPQPTFWVRFAEKVMDRGSGRYEAAARRPGRLAWLEKHLVGKTLAALRYAVPFLACPMAHALPPTGAQLYHEPNFIPLESQLPTVATVHDLSVFLYPQWHPPQRLAYFHRHFRQALPRLAHILAISEFGRRQIIDHLGWPADKVSVTYMGVREGLRRVEGDEQARYLASLNLTPGYLLHVGTLEPRKNLLLLMRAYADLPADVRELHPLVLVGGKGWNADEVHDFLESEGRHKNVRWLGYVEQDAFPALYSGARALLFPTFYEGFGMPTIEMMACGGAVIASTAEAVAETVGGQAHLLDPNDLVGWRDAMRRICADDDWHAELRDGAEAWAQRYTWARCADETLAVYRAVLGLRLAKAA